MLKVYRFLKRFVSDWPAAKTFSLFFEPEAQIHHPFRFDRAQILSVVVSNKAG